MPRELGIALSIEREPVTDTEIRVQALEAIYLITLQVNSLLLCSLKEGFGEVNLWNNEISIQF